MWERAVLQAVTGSDKQKNGAKEFIFPLTMSAKFHRTRSSESCENDD
jgi:hypothetical protein